MTQQTKLEIIKALAYGFDIATVAAYNGVSYAEAEQIALREDAAIKAKQDELGAVDSSPNLLRRAIVTEFAADDAGDTYFVIDVSVYQGHIDWAQVKASGVWGAVLRAGYGMYPHQKDLRFEENYAGAKAAGLHVGAYLYSYAKNADEARRETQVLLGWLDGKQLDMPAYFDQEDGSIPVPSRTPCALAFFEGLHGWYRGYYSYTSWMPSVDLKAIREGCETVWLADYRTNYNKTIQRDMHQYTSGGSIPGIVGRVDCNHCYKDFPAAIKAGGYNGFEKEDEPMEFKEITGKVLRCTSAASPACETFSAPDVNASLGKLALGVSYPITAQGGTVQVGNLTGTWYKITVDGSEVYCLELPDGRCVVEEKPDEPPAVDLTEVLAALARIEAAQAEQGRQLAEVKEQAQHVVDKLARAGSALCEEGEA